MAALRLAKQIVSGPLEQVMKKKQSDEAAAQLYSYTLDLIEHHLEKKLVVRQMLEVREGSRIEI